MMQLPLVNSPNPAIVDDDIYEQIKDKKWRLIKVSNGAFYVGWKSHSKGKDIAVYLHRLVMGNPKGMVDHISGDIFDCSRENLRIATNSQNQMNSKKKIGATSLYKGVSWNSKYQKWKAVIRKDKQDFFLGYFDEQRHAAYAYDFAARDVFGEFARLNFDSTVIASKF